MRVFVSRQIPDAGLNYMRQAGLAVEVWPYAPAPSPAQLLEQTATAQALLCLLSDRIDADFLRQNPQLKVISNYAVGYNNIDVATATRMGIAIGNTPDVLTEATADIAFALLLAVARKLLDSHRDILLGQWQDWEPMGYLGHDLQGKTLGIVGMGRIGQAFARRCVGAYGMKVLYTSNSHKPQAEAELRATRCTLEQLLRESDIVSVHCPLSPATAGMFNREAFRQMKPTAIFINTARGGLHHEADLLAALQHGEIWGAGLDVTNPEPMRPDHPLLTTPNVVITPHIGSATVGTRQAMSLLAAQNIVCGLQGKPLPAFINPEVMR